VSTVDVLSQCIGIEALTLRIVTRESVLRVRNVQSTITRTLHGTKDTATSRSLSQSDVKVDFEWTVITLDFLSDGEAAIWFSNTLVLVGKTNLRQSTTSNEEAGSVCGGPVLETVVDSVIGQFGRVGRCKDDITLELGVNDLADLPTSAAA